MVPGIPRLQCRWAVKACKYQIRNQVSEALFQPPPLPHWSMWACIFCTILFYFFLIFIFNLIEIINSLGLGTACQLTSAPCPDWCVSGVGTWEGRPWLNLGSTLRSETTRKVCGGSGSSRALQVRFQRLQSLFSRKSRCTRHAIHNSFQITRSERVRSSCTPQTRALLLWYCSESFNNPTQVRWEKRNTAHSEKICQPFPFHLLSEIFLKVILNPYLFIGKFRKFYPP